MQFFLPTLTSLLRVLLLADALIVQILVGRVGTLASSSASAVQASTEAWASTSAVSNPLISIPGPTNK